MAALVVATPASQTVSQYVTATMTGGADDKNRLKLDGTVVWTGCHATGDEAQIQLGSVAGTSTITWEQYVAGTWTFADDVTVTVTASSTGTATAFPGTGPSTADALAAMMSNTAIRRIEIAAGTYTGSAGWHLILKNATRGSANSLTVTTAPGAAVIFSGTGGGTGQASAFNINANSGPVTPTVLTDYITFDATGNGGSMAIQNYGFGDFGLFTLGWTDHITMNGFSVSSCTGHQNFTHCIYVQSAGGGSPLFGSSNVTANSWNVAGDAGRTLCGVQTFGEPQGAGRTFHTWTVDKLHTWALIYGTSGSGVDIDGWNGTNCDHTIDSASGQTITGTVKNSNGHGSCGGLVINADKWKNLNLTDGGGNVS